MKKEFIVMIGDLKGSTGIETKDRKILQRKLVSTYKKANISFKRDLYAPIKITLGDEIACVLTSPTNLYRIAVHLLNGIYPHQMRFVFVRGRVTAGLETKDVAIIDGPVFKKAGQYLSLVKRAKTDFIFDLGNPAKDEVLNSLGNLIVEIKHNWTETQRKVAKLYSELKNQVKVARKLKVSQQNVAKTLKSISWGKVYQAENTMNKILFNYMNTT
ncbi:MAG: SatD family protein [Candidatus Zixiibacteriota bacterium]